MKISSLDYIDPNSIIYSLIYQPFPISVSNLSGISDVSVVESKYNNQDIRITLDVIVTSFVSTVSFNFSNTILPTSTVSFVSSGYTSSQPIPIDNLYIKQSSFGTWYTEFTSRESSFGNTVRITIFGST